MKPSISEKQITRYSINCNNGEHGIVAIEFGESFAAVLAETTFGNFSYTWSHTGKDPVHFLQGISFSYGMTKLRHGEYEIFDRHAQELELKRRMFKLRKRRNITSERARELYDEIDYVCRTNSTNEFCSMVYSSSYILDALFESDPSALDPKLKVDPQCEQFWELIWKPLMDHLTEKLANQNSSENEISTKNAPRRAM